MAAGAVPCLLNVPATCSCVLQGRICLDNLTCCHNQTEVADDKNNNNNNYNIERRNSRFHNLLTAPRTVSNAYPQVARVKSCANHV